MYNIDFSCNYKLNDSDEEYKLEFLKAFQLDDWDEDKVKEKMDNIFNMIKNESFLKIMVNKIKSVPQYGFIINLNKKEEEEIAFRMLFCFDYFSLMHECIVDFIKNKKWDVKILNNLLNII